jgi:exosome complex component RRP45
LSGLAFIRQALSLGQRLDSRRLDDFRALKIALTRGESRSSAEVSLNGTRVVCVVTGIVQQPHPDRGSEGILQINTDYSLYAEHIGMPINELRRLLDRAIRESDVIDMESLCIISRELVWKIQCDIQVLDCSGGNMIDCALFAAMAALRAYRKPDVMVHVQESDDEPEDRKQRSKIHVYSSIEREPFPLALHHTPLSCSIALFKLLTKTAIEVRLFSDLPLSRCS